MLRRGHSHEFADRLFKQIQGFGSYGFPESHSASFALLVYVSAWLKCYHPAAFYAGILNSQPMGFYSPSQLVQDARRHNVQVLPVCINHSDWDHTLEHSANAPALRLGLRLVKGVSENSANKLVAARRQRPFKGMDDVKQRQLLQQDELTKLVNVNAFHQFEGNRRRAYWQSLQLDDGLHTQQQHKASFIRPLQPVEELLSDYRHARGVSLSHHPMQLLRHLVPFNRCISADQLLMRRNNSMIEIAGVVTGRQRPGTASGVIFMTLEDETGNINVVLWKGIQERFRQQILTGRILYIKGTLEHQHGVANVVAGYIEQLDHTLPELKTASRNFH